MLKKSNIQPQPPNGSETIVVVRSANPGSIVERLITFKKSVSAAILIARRSFVATLARAWEIPARIDLLATVATFNQQSWAQSSETGAVQLSNGRQAARSSFELAKRRDLRPAFTLIELLVVMGLIGFLASMLTYALLGAQADARVARTRGTITKLNDVILAQWEEYRYRPVDMRDFKQTLVAGTPVDVQLPLGAIEQARLRMLILRDAMRMEMPDRVTDLIYSPTQYTAIAVPPLPGSPFSVNLQRAVPARHAILYRSLRNAIVALQQREQSEPFAFAKQDQLPWSNFLMYDLDLQSHSTQTQISSGVMAPFAGVTRLVTLPTDVDWDLSVNSSELLYLIVASSQYAGTPALENFRPSEIGDPDGDGLLEFIDAWGNAIHWIRWPAGYPSDLNRYSGTDAMDPLKTDWRYSPANGWPESQQPQTIVPLIVSGGADDQFGIVFDIDDFYPPGQRVNSISWPLNYAKMQRPAGRSYIDPFFCWDFGAEMINNPNSERDRPFMDNDPNDVAQRGYRANQLGSTPKHVGGIPNEAHTDNITNHDIILGL